MDYKYHYLYKITNLINNHFYYGIHSTNNLDDGYMGSGHRLKEAVKMYGKENFVKEILKYFKTRELASIYEESVVTEELVRDVNCYNIKIGGDYGTTIGTLLVTDKDDNWLRCSPNDPRYLDGELKLIHEGKVVAYDIKENRYHLIPSDDYYKNRGRYIHVSQGKVTVKDAQNNIYSVSVDDQRYLDGELKPIWCGRKHSSETKEKMRKAHSLNNHQQGCKNSQFGTCWMTKDEKTIKIKKEYVEEYLNNGWVRGRKKKSR